MITISNNLVLAKGVLRQECAFGLSLITRGGSHTGLHLADGGFVQCTDTAEQGSGFMGMDFLGLDVWPMVSLWRDCS